MSKPDIATELLEIPPFVMTDQQTNWYLAGVEAFLSGHSPKGYLKATQLDAPQGDDKNLFFKGWHDAFTADSPEQGDE